MLKVVPGIFVNDEDHLNGLIKVARSFSNEIHVDIADGEFVPTRSVGIEVVQKIVPDGYEYNLHLMTFLTKEGLITWSGTSAKRIFIYSNALSSVDTCFCLATNALAASFHLESAPETNI